MQISAIPIEDWPYGGDSLDLYLFYSRTWTDENGIVRLKGEPGPASPHVTCPGAVDGAAGMVLSFDHPPTTTSPDYPRVRVTGVLFDANGNQRDVLFRGWVFPDEAPVITYKWLSVFNRGVIRRLADKFLTRDQMLSMLADFVGSVLAASDVILGAVLLDAAPADPAAPRAVAVNSPLLAHAIVASGTDQLAFDGNHSQVVIATAEASAARLIKAWSMSSGVTGAVQVPQDEIVEGVSFVIRSAVGGDVGLVGWEITLVP